MYVAVKLYKDVVEKPAGIPDAWPAEVIELGMSRTVPAANWLLMTCDDFIRYKAARQEVYAQWEKATRPPSPEYIDPSVPIEE